MESLPWMDSLFSSKAARALAAVTLAAGMSAAVHAAAKPAGVVVKILQLPEVREHMTADGTEPAYNTPEQFTAFLRADHAKWAKVIKTAGLRETQ